MSALLALGGLAMATTSHAAPESATSPQPLRHVIVRSGPLPYETLAVAVAERLPGVSVRASTPQSFDRARGDAFVYVEIVGDEAHAGPLTLTAILPDGRAFVRTFAADVDDPTRSTAAVIVNVIVAIEQEALTPEQTDAELPPEASPPAPAPEPKPEPEPEPAPESPPQDERTKPTTPPVPRPQRHELGVAATGGTVFGLRRTQFAPIAALSLRARLVGGLWAAAHVRYAGRARDDAALHRVRVAALVGYAWRRGRLQLTAAAGPTVEPWLVADGGRRSTPQPLRNAGRTSPLLGATVVATPALHLVTRPDAIAIDLGLAAALSVSALTSGSDVRIARPDGTELFVFGGPELSLGVRAAVWFPVGRPPAARRAPAAAQPLGRATVRAMSQHRDHRLGRVSLAPDRPIVAGSVGQWVVTYTVGSYGIDEGGTIKVARRFASDFERPQFDDPKGPAFTTATTTGAASLRLHYDPKGHVRPWMKCLVIDVYDGCLSPGDTVTITFGDQSQGSPGIRAQSFIESAHEIRVLVDPTNACLVRRLPSSPVVAIVASEPVAVVPILPTALNVDESTKVFLKGEDRWGNPTPPPHDVQLRWDGEDGVALEGTTLHAHRPTRGRVVATWRGQSFPSNPLTVHERAPQYGRYWADLHAQSDATVGTGTEVEYFTFGRDWAHLDVMCHQGNDFQVTDADWTRLNDVVRAFHEDGRFVVFPGFEWSANTPAGGDRNVMYLEEDLPIFRSSHWQVDEPESEDTPAHPADGLFAALRRRVDPSKVCVASHCGGRYADIRKYFDGEFESLVEVASCWGVFEWLLFDAFDHGYRVGIMCNSDGHKGRPGAEGPGAGQFGIYGGLTCILAESLTRADVFTALKERRCYGTTGPRIDLSFHVDGKPMGSALSIDGPVNVTASLHGTAPVEALELWSGRNLVTTVRPPSFDDLADSRRVRLWWGGARIRGRGRRATWDGAVTLRGAKLERAEPFGFDSPADGIEAIGDDRVAIRSRTTGDLDGVDLWLTDATSGTLRFDNDVGPLEVDLAELSTAPRSKSCGGLDLRATVQRYPEQPTDRTLTLTHQLTRAEAIAAPLWVKAIQTDGHLAWASPIYLS